MEVSVSAIKKDDPASDLMTLYGAKIANLGSVSGGELTALAIDGLCRLAFGSASDAVRLALCEEAPSPGELSGMDLFLISEIKRPKPGSCEVKLHDRMTALELLAQYGERRKDGTAAGFLEALRSAAPVEPGE